MHKGQEMVNHKGVMSFGHCFKLITSLAIPMALSYTFSLTIVAIGILGGLLYHDAEHAAAITLIMTSVNTLIIIGFSPLFAISILVSNFVGGLTLAKDSEELNQQYKKISAVNRSGLQIIAVVTPLFFVLMFFSKFFLVNVLDQPENIATIVQEFLRIYAFAVPAVLMRVCFEQIMFSFSKAKAAMTYSLMSFSIGTILAYLLSHGGLGISGIGLRGIAMGYLIEAYLTAIFFACYLQYKKEFSNYCFFTLIYDSGMADGLTKKLMSIGLPISFTIANEMLLTFVLVMIAGKLGEHQLAAINFSMQIIFFMFVIFSAFGQACCQEVSRQVGAKDYINARKVAVNGLLTTLCCLLPMCLILLIKSKTLIQYFIVDNAAVIHLSIALVPFVTVAIFFDAARYNILQVLRALHDHMIAMVLSTIALWSSIILSISLGLYTHLGLKGVIYGYLFGIIVSTILLLPRWTSNLKFQVGHAPRAANA